MTILACTLSSVNGTMCVRCMSEKTAQGKDRMLNCWLRICRLEHEVLPEVDIQGCSSTQRAGDFTAVECEGVSIYFGVICDGKMAARRDTAG